VRASCPVGLPAILASLGGDGYAVVSWPASSEACTMATRVRRLRHVSGSCGTRQSGPPHGPPSGGSPTRPTRSRRDDLSSPRLLVAGGRAPTRRRHVPRDGACRRSVRAERCTPPAPRDNGNRPHGRSPDASVIASRSAAERGRQCGITRAVHTASRGDLC
jgi:hypothetical protein